MSAPIIQANYDQIEQIAGRFGQTAERCVLLEQKVRGTYDPLANGGWLGRGAASFTGEMEGVLFPALQRLQAALEAAREVTIEVRARLLEAEREAAALFQGQSGEIGSGMRLMGAASTAAGLVGAAMKGVALNALLPGQYVLRALTPNLARGQSTVAMILDTMAGQRGRGLWLLRFDLPHDSFPHHLNINPKLSGMPDPHLTLPPGIVRAAGTGARLLEGARRVALPVAVATDIFRLGSAVHADGNTIGEETKRTAGSVAGGWAGAAAGAKLGVMGGAALGGALGTVVPVIGNVAGAGIGGVLGGLIGGIGGGLGGSWLGEQVGAHL